MPIQENIASSRSQYKKMLASRGNWEWLNCDSSRGIRWNIVWALGKSRAPPPWFSSGPGNISSHTPPLVTLQLQYSLPTQISTTLYWFSFNNQPIVCANTWLHVHAYYWQICDLAARMLNHCTVRQKGPNIVVIGSIIEYIYKKKKKKKNMKRKKTKLQNFIRAIF